MSSLFPNLESTDGYFRINLIAAAEHFAQTDMLLNDCSHDWNHVLRVRRMALFLAAKENVDDTFAVELAALLHDVKDQKYSHSVCAGPDSVREFLAFYNCPQSLLEKVVFIVSNVSYSKEVASTGAPVTVTPELAVVQDADRLDALGAIGIARVFAFTGASQFTTEPDGSRRLSVLEDGAKHLADKILHIASRLKTQTARAIGAVRHEQVKFFMAGWNAEMEADKMFFPQ